MSKKSYTPFLSLLLLSSLHQPILAVQYNVITTVPCRRFDIQVTVPFALKRMRNINEFIWKTFKQSTRAQRKYVPTLTINVTKLDEGALTQTSRDTIYIDCSVIENFPIGWPKYEFTSLLHHEMTLIFQWTGHGTAPGGLTDGVAEYVKLKSNFYDHENYIKPGEGEKWDEGYGVTARFLEYCDSLRNGFTADLNNKMRKVYKDEYFKELLGNPLDRLWRDYKAKYGHKTLVSDIGV